MKCVPYGVTPIPRCYKQTKIPLEQLTKYVQRRNWDLLATLNIFTQKASIIDV